MYELTGLGHDEQKCQLRRRVPGRVGATHHDAQFFCCDGINGGIDLAGGDHHFEVGQLRQHIAWQGGALAHDAEHLKRFQLFDQARGVGLMRVEEHKFTTR